MKNGSKVQKKTPLLTELRTKKSIYLMILPFAVFFVVFTVAPVAFAIVMSFTNYNVIQSPSFVGLDNYIDLFLNDDLFLTAVQNTFIMAVIVGPVGYILSFCMAWMLCELPTKLRVVMTVILYGPSLSGNAYMIWTLIFSDDSTGYMNSLLMSLGVTDSAILWLHDTSWMMFIVLLVQLWMSFGVGFLSFIAGLQGVDSTQLEAGMVDGITTRWQELWYIVLPSMRPVLLFCAVLSFTSAYSISGSALTGFPSTGYATHSIVDHLGDYGTTRLEMGYASAIAVILFLLMVGSNRLIQRLLRKVGT
ncbi:MAG: sugar ABC transporter permease [Lachnospiraceae bacterium]|nr:sugar ABC transporter permease [Lachnospiraceae bacterium]